MIRHWIFNIIAAISIVLCLAMLGLWARSRGTYDAISNRWMSGYVGVASSEGTCGLVVDFSRRGMGWNRPPLGWTYTVTKPVWMAVGNPGSISWQAAGQRRWSVLIGFHCGFYPPGDFHWEMPDGFLALLFALIASGRVIRNLLQKLPSIPSETRRKFRRALRLFLISLVTVGIVLPVAVPLLGYNAREGWAAVWGTPLIYLLFITVPVGGVMLAFSTLQLQRGRLVLRKKRHLCKQCGYNLTGNTSGLCPECGASIERKTDVPRVVSEGGAS